MGQIELFNHLQRIIIISYLKSYNCWTDRVSSMGQIELFNHLLRIIIISYWKPPRCVQIIYITKKYLINRITNVKKQYLKSSNCVQTND